MRARAREHSRFWREVYTRGFTKWKPLYEAIGGFISLGAIAALLWRGHPLLAAVVVLAILLWLLYWGAFSLWREHNAEARSLEHQLRQIAAKGDALAIRCRQESAWSPHQRHAHLQQWFEEILSCRVHDEIPPYMVGRLEIQTEGHGMTQKGEDSAKVIERITPWLRAYADIAELRDGRKKGKERARLAVLEEMVDLYQALVDLLEGRKQVTGDGGTELARGWLARTDWLAENALPFYQSGLLVKRVTVGTEGYAGVDPVLWSQWRLQHQVLGDLSESLLREEWSVKPGAPIDQLAP